MGIVREFIEDPEYLESTLRKWGSIVAGGLFSGGWWCWADAVPQGRYPSECAWRLRRSRARAAILVRHVCALAPACFAGGPLCTGTCPLRREGLR